MEEVWKDIKGYEGLYQVSNMGRIRNSKGCIMKQAINEKGYMRIRLCKDGKKSHLRIHRLVADAFIPNPDNKEEVNHISCMKSDNRVSNLEWVSSEENHRLYKEYRENKVASMVMWGIILSQLNIQGVKPWNDRTVEEQKEMIHELSHKVY